MKTIQGPEDPLYKTVVACIRRHCGPPVNHRCVPQECFRGAESEFALVQRGVIPGPPLTCNVFLTRCRTIHLCSENTCTLYSADPSGTCPVSGIQYGAVVSSYDRNDPRTWYSRPAFEGGSAPEAPTEPPPAKRVVRRPVAEPLTEEQKAKRAADLVKLLLWSPERVTRNRTVLKQLEESAQTACDNYVDLQRQEGQPPIWTDLFRIRGHMMSQQALLQVLPFDESQHDYYVSLLTQVWDRAVRFYVRGPRPVNVPEPLPRREFDCVALAALYGMRQGDYHREGVSILPRDEFLARELPVIFDLEPYFGISADLITRGQKILRRAFDNAFADKVPPGQIELDTGRIAQAAQPTAAAAATPAAVVTRDERNRQVKITHKGERLFMPISRRKKLRK